MKSETKKVGTEKKGMSMWTLLLILGIGFPLFLIVNAMLYSPPSGPAPTPQAASRNKDHYDAQEIKLACKSEARKEIEKGLQVDWRPFDSPEIKKINSNEISTLYEVKGRALVGGEFSRTFVCLVLVDHQGYSHVRNMEKY